MGRLTFRRKLSLVGGMAFGKGQSFGTRVEGLSGLLALVVVCVAVVCTPGAAYQREWLAVFAGAGLLAVFGANWAVCWRKAVDWPMGHVWFHTSGVRRLIGSGWLAIGLANAARGSWFWAVLDFGLAALSFYRFGDGGGWDDVPAPDPTPSDGIAR